MATNITHAEQFINDYVATGLARFEYRFLPAVDPTYSPLSAKLAECADILIAMIM